MNRHWTSAVAVMMLATPVAAAPVRDARFDAFFAGFRKAVLAGDRRAVARMTHFPFTDYRVGRYCDPGDSGCKPAADNLSCADEAAFLRRYDRIFSPQWSARSAPVGCEASLPAATTAPSTARSARENIYW